MNQQASSIEPPVENDHFFQKWTAAAINTVVVKYHLKYEIWVKLKINFWKKIWLEDNNLHYQTNMMCQFWPEKCLAQIASA